MEQKLSNADFRMLSIVWEKEPLSSPELCKLCLEELGWKKSTTYTVLKRLCEKEYLKNENTLVSALEKREEVQQAQSREVVEQGFGGSLPKFIAAFAGNRGLSAKEAEEIKRIIDKYGEEGK